MLVLYYFVLYTCYFAQLPRGFPSFYRYDTIDRAPAIEPYKRPFVAATSAATANN